MDDFARYYMMSVMNVFVAPIVTVAVALPVVIYILARWRSYRDHGGGDPHLGLKLALCFFKLVGFQLALLGGFMLMYGTLSDAGKSATEMMHRTAGGLLLPGLIIYGVHTALLNRTNWRQMPAVVRMFNGVNLINTGLIGCTALVIACFLLFQKDVPGEMERLAWSMVLVYTSAWGILGVLFGQSTLSGDVPPAYASYPNYPSAGAPPAPPAPPPPAAASGGPQG